MLSLLRPLIRFSTISLALATLFPMLGRALILLEDWRFCPAYFRYILRHKQLVNEECVKLGMPRPARWHDLSKFSWAEFRPYARYFYGPRSATRTQTAEEKAAMDLAFLHHIQHNPHHWQSFVLITDDGKLRALPMPLARRQEMLADWNAMSAARGYPDCRRWYESNQTKLTLHPETRAWLEGKIASWAPLPTGAP